MPALRSRVCALFLPALVSDENDSPGATPHFRGTPQREDFPNIGAYEDITDAKDSQYFL